MEGVVLRQDEDDWLQNRFKVVRPDFVRGCQDGHWTRRAIEKQTVDYEFAEIYRERCYEFAEAAPPGDKTGTAVPLLLQTVEETKPVAKAGGTKSRKAKRQAALEKQAAQNDKNRRRRVPRCVMLCGLPGNGKSTFAERLIRGFNQDGVSWLVANQDDLGRKECQRVAGRASRKTRVIVDRCNLTTSERREWLECMHNPKTGEVAMVFFGTPTETCIERVQDRVDHPTIAHGKGAGIVRQLAGKLEPPTPTERQSVFGIVEHVTSFEETNALLRKWGVPA